LLTPLRLRRPSQARAPGDAWDRRHGRWNAPFQLDSFRRSPAKDWFWVL